MRESVKSICLAVLVVGSLIQTFYLANSNPQYDTLTPTEYLPSEQNGNQAELANLASPEQIILHLGGQKHTVLTQQHQFFQLIYNNFVREKRFDGFRRTTVFVGNAGLEEELRNDRTGIEIRFREGVPLNYLQTILQIREDSPVENDYISRIWISQGEGKDEVRAYFFSDLSVYEATKLDMDSAELKKQVSFGEYLTGYHTENGSYYLPDIPLQAVRYTIPFTIQTSDKLIRSLFVDPSLAWNIQDRDGQQFYTDSRRGLQLKNDQKWFVYTDPVTPPADSKNDPKENLLSAVQFVNQHGGWDSSYLFAKITPKSVTGSQTILFRQILDGYPIIPTKQEMFGYIKLVLQKGVVSNYERSLLNLDMKTAQKAEMSLPGGAELDNRLKDHEKRAQIKSVFPAYHAVVGAQTVEFIPGWAIELRDGSYEFL